MWILLTHTQDNPSKPPSEVPSGETEEATSIHLTKVYRSLSCGTEDMSAFDQALSINWQMNAILLTQVPCPVTSTFHPGSKLLALLGHTFAEYLFLCLLAAHGKTSLHGSCQVPLDYGQTKLPQTFCEDDSYDYPMISDLPKQDHHGPGTENCVSNATSVFRSFKFYFVWYTQQHIVADTIFSAPRSSSYTHQVSNCHSNLVTTPSSSIDLTSQSVPHLSLPFLCRIFLILDKLKIEMTKDSLHHAGKSGEHSYGENLPNAGKNGEHSCVENFHGDNLNSHNINKLSCSHQSLPEHQASKIYEYLTKRNIKSNQHMDNPNAFSNHVKTTLNHGLSLSEVDLGDLKRETTKHGPSLMEVDWGGKIKPNYTSSQCILMQVDWGGKLRVTV